VGLIVGCGWLDGPLRFGLIVGCGLVLMARCGSRCPARGGQSARFAAFVRMLSALVIVSMCHCACSFLADVTSTSIGPRSAAASELGRQGARYGLGSEGGGTAH